MFFYKNNNLKIENANIRNSKYGVYLAHSLGSSITNSIIENNSYYDLYNVDQEQAYAFYNKGGTGMCYDQQHKVCPFEIKSEYYVKISGCPDLNGDGIVNEGDVPIFNQAYPSQWDANYLPSADFDSDGDVDGSDLVVFSSNFGRVS